MNLRRLFRTHLAPYKKTLLIIVAFQIIQTVATLILPSLNADIVDKGVIPGDNGYIGRIGLIMILFTVIQVVFQSAAVYYGAKVAMGFGRDVRRDVFHQVTEFSSREVGKFGAPSLITRTTNDVQQVQMLVVMIITVMIAAPLTMVVGTFLAMREDLGLSVVLVIAIPVVMAILGLLIASMVPAFERMQGQIDRVNLVMREQITGLRVVRAFVREPQEKERFADANANLTKSSLTAGRLMSAMFPIAMFVINVSSVAVLWVGADRIADGKMQVGALIAYLSYLIQILIAVATSTFMIGMVPRAAVAAERIVEVLDTVPTVQAAVDAVETVPQHGTIEFRNVGFHYPGAEHAVLEGVSFSVNAGETTAIIGSTGSGKTTLVSLVPRLFDATSGQVLVNGIDVRELDPSLLWGEIGYVPQKPYLFSGTVASNLRFGRPDATDEELWEALEIAQGADFVREMPLGLDAPVSQGGTNVSGGQRQRLSIARALVVKPALYVFDDSFSALDLATDARLRAALKPHVSEAAMLVVAQRVNTIIDADQIVVLEDGEVVGAGRHGDLLKTCPTYVEIVESQLGQGAAA